MNICLRKFGVDNNPSLKDIIIMIMKGYPPKSDTATWKNQVMKALVDFHKTKNFKMISQRYCEITFRNEDGYEITFTINHRRHLLADTFAIEGDIECNITHSFLQEHQRLVRKECLGKFTNENNLVSAIMSRHTSPTQNLPAAG